MPRVMRVLTRPNVGGPTRQMVALWHAFAELGWQTLLVVGQCEDEPAVDLAAEGIPQIAREAVNVNSVGFVVVSMLRRGVHPVRDGLARWRMGQLMHAFAPDVVHTHTSKAGALARSVARELEIGVVAHTFHGHVLQDYFGRWRAWLVRRAERYLARRTHLLFAVSPSCRDELVAFGVARAERIAVVPPAVDVRRFVGGSRTRAREELGLAADAFVLGFVGRLVPVKRPQMFAELVARVPEAIGLVFGDGPLRSELEGAPRLRLLGATDRLPRWLVACDAVIFTSVREGCPLAAVEAFAAGVPVVGLAVPGVQDVLGEWGAGVLVPPEQGVDGLVAACASLKNVERATQLVATAQASVSRFEPLAVARALVSHYEPALVAAAARADRLRLRTRTSLAVVDWVLCVPLVWGAVMVAVTPFMTFANMDFWSVFGYATATACVIMSIAGWRYYVVRNRYYRILVLDLVLALCVIGLMLMGSRGVDALMVR